jgi:hypothetical protein
VDDVTMKVVGRRTPAPPTAGPSGASLLEGARFNESLQRLPTGDTTFIPKGVYHYKTHEDAQRHAEECLIRGMARIASQGR